MCVVTAGSTCAHRLRNVQQVCSLTQSNQTRPGDHPRNHATGKKIRVIMIVWEHITKRTMHERIALSPVMSFTHQGDTRILWRLTYVRW